MIRSRNRQRNHSQRTAGFIDRSPQSCAGTVRGSALVKAICSFLFVLLLPVPALAKAHDVYPVSCDDLWKAVDHTLSDSRTYAVIVEDAVNKRASLVVVGAMVVFKDRVALTAMGTGCQMKLTFTQIGPDNSDERGFKNRVMRALAKMQAAKLAPPAKPEDTITGSQ